jgi:methionyl aminopeptidase
MAEHRRRTPPRSEPELRAMREAGRVVAEIHERTRDRIAPGVTTAQLDRIARDVIERRGARSNFLGYHGFPAVICASPNEVVVHGIPGKRRLEEGDIISVDCGAVVRGWHADAAFTAPVGTVSRKAARLIEVTRQSMLAGIAAMVGGNRLGDVGQAVQTITEDAGFAVVRDYVGHGIGRALHEKPDVPNEGRAGKGRRIQVGDTYALEPMVSAGSPLTRELDDGWTVVTTDGAWAAHWEHTIAVTEDGPEILTQSDVT